jgi:2-methylcitrate dehydratase PrpD
VQRIRLGVLSGGALLVADPIEQKRNPQSVVDAQFSAPYAAAAALVFGTGGIDAYSPDKLQHATVRDLMARTECYRDPALDAPYPQQWPAAAEIQLKDGRVVSTRVEFATGEPENPVPREALIQKFVSLAADSTTNPAALAEIILNLDTERDLDALSAALHKRSF